MNIIKSSAYMKSNMTEKSSLETECLFGEVVEIIKDHQDWAYCKLITDNYRGWVKKNNLGKFNKATHRVILKRTFIYEHANEKSETLIYLPMGSRLTVEKIKKNWVEIAFSSENKKKIGYVPRNHIVNIEHKVKDWVSVSQQLEGTPYKYGGRDTLGLDCSALLQISYQTYGYSIPRNTSEQIKLKKPKINTFNHLKRGCVIFWEGHVGIMIDEINCIHANAFHMKTVTEPLSNIITRMDKDCNIIKMMNFN